MGIWCEVRKFASQKFRLTPALHLVLSSLNLYENLQNLAELLCAYIKILLINGCTDMHLLHT